MKSLFRTGVLSSAKLMSAAMLACLLFTGCSAPAPWPTKEWKTSTPEQQGVDSSSLAMLFELLKKQKESIHSIVVVRHGVVIAEAYLPPYKAETKQSLNSATKSVISALVGQAVAKGKIGNIQEKILDFFPDKAIDRKDDQKQAITVENLLTMSSGLDWPKEGDPETDLEKQYRNSPDWVKFVLDRPVTSKPGTTFADNSLASHVLSAAVQKRVGTPAFDFAREELFKPLGIDGAEWAADPSGITKGGRGLRMTARDAAKLGYLYLHGGNWDGKQIVPSDWVKASTTKVVTAGNGDGYGYSWWIEPTGGYSAQGFGGQRIVVVPELDLVLVMTADLGVSDTLRIPLMFMKSYILPAIGKTETLPENSAGVAQLKAAIDAATHEEAQDVAEAPANQKIVDGKIYSVAANDLGIEKVSLSFKEKEAQLTLTVNGKAFVLPVGLDDLYRSGTFVSFKDSGVLGSVALKGQWEGDKTFGIEFNSLVDGLSAVFNFEFDGDKISILIQGPNLHDLINGKRN